MRSRHKDEHNGTVAGLDDAKAFGVRLRELRLWRGLTLREAAGLAGLSFSFWGQAERGKKEINSRKTLEAMAGALRIHPSELTEHPWAPRDTTCTAANAGLRAMATALEDYQLGADPGLTVRPWPQLVMEVQRLVTTMVWPGDYAGQCELAPVLIGELHGAYLRLPHQRPEVLVGLMTAYSSVIWTCVRLGALGLPSMAASSMLRCAEIVDDPVWLGYATRMRGSATGELNRAAHYQRSVAAAESLSSQLDNGQALLMCGLLHLDAAYAAGAQADHDTAATHLQEASALAARMDTEMGILADLGFGSANVTVYKTAVAMELHEPGQALEAAKTAHPELLPSLSHQANFWSNVGRALAAEKRTREKAVRVLVHAEQMAPQRVHNNLLVREVVAELLGQALSQVGRRELRALAWRMGLTPIRQNPARS